MSRGQPLDLPHELLENFDHAMRVTEHLVSVLPAPIWRARAPEPGVRTIAAIVAHVQSVRRVFAKMGGARPVPPSLDRARCTKEEALQALVASRYALLSQFDRALSAGETRVKGMPRRVVNMAMYLVQHDAHHRGQITSLARALNYRLSTEDVMRIWGWKKLP